jgi:hypothetical protein
VSVSSANSFPVSLPRIAIISEQLSSLAKLCRELPADHAGLCLQMNQSNYKEIHMSHSHLGQLVAYGLSMVLMLTITLSTSP